jgi:hypothetical protein
VEKGRAVVAQACGLQSADGHGHHRTGD